MYRSGYLCIVGRCYKHVISQRCPGGLFVQGSARPEDVTLSFTCQDMPRESCRTRRADRDSWTFQVHSTKNPIANYKVGV